MLTANQILESCVEAIKETRRYGPNFPTPFDLSKIVWDTSEQTIVMELLDDGKIRKFKLLLSETVTVDE